MKLHIQIKMWAIVAFIGFIVLLNCFTTVPAGHVKVPTVFGEVKQEALGEGLHFVNPLAKFDLWDARDITVDIANILVPAQDKMKTDMDITLVLRFQKEGTPYLLGNVGEQGNVIDQIVVKKARSLIREAGKSVEQSQDFFLDEVQTGLQDNIKAAMNAYLLDYKVEVKAVLFRDITLPRLVSSAIEDTKERQEKLNQEIAQLAIVEQQAQQKVKQAEAREQAAVADANATRTTADATAYRIEVEAEAQAKANAKLAKSITNNLIEYKRIERWNGQVPHVSAGDSGMIFSVK